MPAKYEVFEDKAGEWRWHLLAANGEPVAASESYATPEDAERGSVDAHVAALGAARPRIVRKTKVARKAKIKAVVKKRDA